MYLIRSEAKPKLMQSLATKIFSTRIRLEPRKETYYITKYVEDVLDEKVEDVPDEEVEDAPNEEVEAVPNEVVHGSCSE